MGGTEALLEGVAHPVDGCVPKSSLAGRVQVDSWVSVSARALYQEFSTAAALRPEGLAQQWCQVPSGFMITVPTSNVHFQHFLTSPPMLTLFSLSGMPSPPLESFTYLTSFEIQFKLCLPDNVFLYNPSLGGLLLALHSYSSFSTAKFI